MESGWGFELPYEQHLQPDFKILKNLRAVELELYVGDGQLNSYGTKAIVTRKCTFIPMLLNVLFSNKNRPCSLVRVVAVTLQKKNHLNIPMLSR